MGNEPKVKLMLSDQTTNQTSDSSHSGLTQPMGSSASRCGEQEEETL